MRLLLCCESYFPHRGGVQEVMRQIGERLAAKGHDVTVATSWHPKRNSYILNGVNIRQFRASGKLAYALNGEIEEYRQFVEDFGADAILVMAAQQWSFDALWPALDRITARKVFIPCGFSCLYEPDFADYYAALPKVLKKFQHFIFNANRYRDIDFVKRLGLTNFTVLPNGINEKEFDPLPNPQFRKRLGLRDDDFVFMSVGNPIEAKGHRELIEAFRRLDPSGRSVALLAIANWPRRYPKSIAAIMAVLSFGVRASRRITEILVSEGISGAHKFISRGLRDRFGTPAVQPVAAQAIATEVVSPSQKKVILIDLNRADLIQAYKMADLFVFASRIEYSPLVLYEAAAAGTPFLSVPVGNATEIVSWTGGGVLCEAPKDDLGYTRVDPDVLSREMARCMNDPDMLNRLSATSLERWRANFSWQVIVDAYEAILMGKDQGFPVGEFRSPTCGDRSISGEL